MPIRNPFAKRPGVSNGVEVEENPKPSFERVDTVGSKASSAMSISSGQSQEPAEYKMSVILITFDEQVADSTLPQTVVNDSGVFIPPSPPEKKSFWPRRTNPSTTSTNTASSLSEFEPFSISRASFDSYRRSFDISAKSPVIATEVGRQSLDSAKLPRLPRSAIGERRFEREPPTAEEGFEDVGLNDEQNKPKKRSFFPKFGEPTEPGTIIPPPTSATSTSRFHLPGRKRGQSGQGAELGSIGRPAAESSQDIAKETKT